MCMDEVHNFYFKIRNTIVVRLVEVMTNRKFKVLAVDIVEMSLEIVSWLSNILDDTNFTGDAVD